MDVKIKKYYIYDYIALLKIHITARNYIRKKEYYRAVAQNEHDTIEITLGKVNKIRDNKKSIKPSPSAVKNILIVATSGILVTNYKTDNDALVGQEEDLIASLVSAIKSFANVLRAEEIERIEMTSTNVTVLPSMANSLIFFMVTEHNERKRRCRIVLEEIRDEVVERYRSLLIGDAVTEIPLELSRNIRDIIEKVLSKHGYC